MLGILNSLQWGNVHLMCRLTESNLQKHILQGTQMTGEMEDNLTTDFYL